MGFLIPAAYLHSLIHQNHLSVFDFKGRFIILALRCHADIETIWMTGLILAYMSCVFGEGASDKPLCRSLIKAPFPLHNNPFPLSNVGILSLGGKVSMNSCTKLICSYQRYLGSDGNKKHNFRRSGAMLCGVCRSEYNIIM